MLIMIMIMLQVSGVVVLVESALAAAQQQSLVDLYDSANGASWSQKVNWPMGDPCNASLPWFGVTCDAGRTNVL